MNCSQRETAIATTTESTNENVNEMEKILKDLAMRNGIIENHEDIVECVNDYKKDMTEILECVKGIQLGIKDTMAELEKRLINKIDNIDLRLIDVEKKTSYMMDKIQNMHTQFSKNKSKNKDVIHIKNI